MGVVAVLEYEEYGGERGVCLKEGCTIFQLIGLDDERRLRLSMLFELGMESLDSVQLGSFPRIDLPLAWIGNAISAADARALE